MHRIAMYIASMINKELVAASSRPLILGILSERENYGYAIIQRVRELSEAEMQWSDGMLYPILHRLERDGLIESNWRRSETGRKRKCYRLKRDGRKALATDRRQWISVYSTLMKLKGMQTC